MHPAINTRDNAQAVVDLFRSMLATDPAATRALFGFRVGCNQALADHPAVIVRGSDEPWMPAEGPPRGRWDVGILGVVNALFGPTHRVATVCDDVTGEVLDFKVATYLANGPDAAATVVVDRPPPRSRIGERMRADYSGSGYSTAAAAVCVKDRGGWITCHIDEGHTLTAFTMSSSEWDDRRNRWLADGAPALPRADE